MRAPEAAAVPLTSCQRVHLALGCVPFALALAAWLAAATLLRESLGARGPLLLAVGGAVVLALGWRAVQRLRDLLAGVAWVEVDRLVRKLGARGTPANAYYAHFERLGRMRLVRGSHVQGVSGQRYRVHHSRASRLVWRLEHAGP